MSRFPRLADWIGNMIYGRCLVGCWSRFPLTDACIDHLNDVTKAVLKAIGDATTPSVPGGPV